MIGANSLNFYQPYRKPTPGSLPSIYKWIYLRRTILEISHYLVSLEKRLRNRFIPAITGGHICNDTERKLLFLPARFGGIAIPVFYKQAEVGYSNSRKLADQLAPQIKNQIKQSTVDNTQIKTTKQVIKKEKQHQCHTSLDQLRKIYHRNPKDHLI